ncbi:MAG: AAA family ATPase [Ruminococcaceae bacterium]|nr:AAA family ATPase [Oscillospiraceae bacterium]
MKSGYSHMKCGLLGEHLGHSFSPQIHRELADYSYELFEVEPNGVENFVKNGTLDAYNVTIPYKKTVMPFLDVISQEALAIGSVNTVVRKNGKLYGYNTDYFGFDHMITASGIEPKGKKAIVFGTGGASVTVCAVLRDRGVSELCVIGIEDNTKENLIKHGDAQIIVNATPVGMYPKNLAAPVDLSLFPKCEGVLDVVYNPARTALLLDAEKRNIAYSGGLSMLVAQAVKAFEFFTGDKSEDGITDKILQSVAATTQNIILVGMPGCGKSTLGKLLAKKLDRPFFDADDEFTSTYGVTPANVITEQGEDKFRQMEHDILCELGKKSGAVISCGGGAVTREYNYEPLHQNGVIIFLERALENLSTHGRPLSQKSNVQELYAARIDKYHRFADIEIKSTEIPDKTANAVLEALDGFRYVR